MFWKQTGLKVTKIKLCCEFCLQGLYKKNLVGAQSYRVIGMLPSDPVTAGGETGTSAAQNFLSAAEDALSPSTAEKPRAVSRHTILKLLALERTNPGLSVLLSSFILSGLEFLFCCTTINGFTTMMGLPKKRFCNFLHSA